MEVIYSLKDIKKNIKNSGVALGTFDGLHKGHQILINKLIEECKAKKLISIVYTFSNHPREITNSQKVPKMILSNKQKIDLFGKAGIDVLLLLKFDNYYKNIEAEDFVQNILLKKLNMNSMVVGFDCKFGKDAKGNINSLEEFSKKYGFSLNIIEPIKIKDEIVSSTLIRKYLSQGNIHRVNLLLGRNYSIIGTVKKGKGLGRKIGFPTANITINNNLCFPRSGVYITKTQIENKSYYSITNIGFNPTFIQKDLNIETYIFNFNNNIYNKEIKIEFYRRIRDEIKFDNSELLCQQIKKDILYTKKYFNLI